MFTPTKAKTVKAYLAAVPDERKEAVLFFHNLIKKTVPKLKPYLAYNMLGYGAFPYLNYKKEKISWPIIALANQKNYISIYVCALEDKKYLPEKYKKELGKVSVGKSRIRFKRHEDVDIKTLQTILKKAAKHPGLREE